MSTALFVGRFQPVHNGHIQIIKNILKENDHIIIAIGSSQEYGTENNPLSGKAREKLIKDTLKEEKIPTKKYTILQIPDLNNPQKWANYLIDLTPPFETLYTGSSFTKKCFEKTDKIILDIPRINNISATEIRHQIRQNDPTWKNLVPKIVAKTLDKNLFIL